MDSETKALLANISEQLTLQTRIMAEQVNLFAIANRIDFKLGFKDNSADEAPPSNPEADAAIQKAIIEKAKEQEAAAEKKAAAEKAKAKAEAAAKAKAEAEAEAAKEPETTLTEDDVKKALSSYRALEGSPALLELLNKYGATNIKELKPSVYDAIYKDAGGGN